MKILDKLYYDLQDYEPQSQDIETHTLPDKNKNLFSKLTNVFKPTISTKDLIERPKSLYIYGGAGCGKVFIIMIINYILYMNFFCI